MSRSFVLPDGLPVPVDDGAAAHLAGSALPAVVLPTTAGRQVSLAELGRAPSVLFFYPRTGRPEEPPAPGWDLVPGARG